SFHGLLRKSGPSIVGVPASAGGRLGKSLSPSPILNCVIAKHGHTPKAFHCPSPGFRRLLRRNPGYLRKRVPQPRRGCTGPSKRFNQEIGMRSTGGTLSEFEKGGLTTQGSAAKGRRTLGFDGVTPSA